MTGWGRVEWAKIKSSTHTTAAPSRANITMPNHCPGPVSRRSFLQAGTVGLGGLGLNQLMSMRAQASPSAAKDTACIFVWLPGGPPHMEMYDMKPGAPSEYRGEFAPIRTNVSGIEVCELLPMHAKVADKFSIIRSVHHTFSDHGGGHKRFMTGRDPKAPTGFVNDYPACGSMISMMLEREERSDLNYVLMTDQGRQGIDVYSLGTAYLNSATAPFTVAGDPSKSGFRVNNLSLASGTERRLLDRSHLLSHLDQLRRDIDRSGTIGAMDELNQNAMNLLTSGSIRQAFDLSRESDETKERFGRHAWGYRALMARRLVEAGCPFVTLVLENPFVSGVPFPKDGTYNWDSHAVNCHLFRDARVRFPIYDRTVTALIEDLYERGLDQRVLLVVTGEFGRTPRLEYRPGTQTKVTQPGRDHWPQAMSMIVSGGGAQHGQIIGATNSRGEEPSERPLSPNDIWATIFRHLGIDYRHHLLDHNGRPMPILPHGEPVHELLG